MTVGLKVLTGHGAAIDTTTDAGKLVFGIFAALAEFERELISERTLAGLASARARGRKGGRPFKMTAAKLRLAMAAMGQPETKVSELCKELDINYPADTVPTCITERGITSRWIEIAFTPMISGSSIILFFLQRTLPPT